MRSSEGGHIRTILAQAPRVTFPNTGPRSSRRLGRGSVLRRPSPPRPCEQEGHHQDSTEVADRGGEADDREHDASGENDVPPAAPGAREPDDEARQKNNREHHDLYTLFQRPACSGDSGERRVTFPNAGPCELRGAQRPTPGELRVRRGT